MKLVHVNQGVFKNAEFSDRYKPGFDIFVVINIKDSTTEYSNYFKPSSESIFIKHIITEVLDSIYKSIESEPDADFLAIGNSIVCIDSIQGIDIVIKSPDYKEIFNNEFCSPEEN